MGREGAREGRGRGFRVRHAREFAGPLPPSPSHIEAERPTGS